MTERKEKFTPGPWEVIFQECGLGNISQRKFTVRGGGHSVAGCYCTNPDKNAENDANGYLIAAAPEMYELLQHYADLLDAGDATAECRMYEDRALIEKVLKKVRGEE